MATEPPLDAHPERWHRDDMSEAARDALEIGRQQMEWQRDATARAFVESGRANERAKSQAFFAEYATQARSPSAGDHFKQFVLDMLRRAGAAGLYTEIE